MPTHIIIDDRDDRPEQMIKDPDGYFEAARRRAEIEVQRQGRPLFPALRRQFRS